MIIAGIRPPGFDVARAERARRAADASRSGQSEPPEDDAAEADPAIDLRSLTVAMFSWSTMHPDLVARWQALCGDELGLLEVFGQTEAMSCYRFWAGQWPEKVASSLGPVNHVGALFEDRAFLERAPDPEGEQHDREAGQERNAPAPAQQLLLGQGVHQDDPQRRCGEGSGVGAEAHQGGNEAAAAPRRYAPVPRHLPGARRCR